ncbi:hypothetical protein D4764_19G0003720 [Takifugu flavidus]|uniref:Uncharacterized protein n=1 Tax=Takifugu flavidus TaxID=433684 RepID=A0A5C6NMG3_9TELE|nr:hypothetical protein D4764_19G0003720 [Takifugu flavidus]
MGRLTVIGVRTCQSRRSLTLVRRPVGGPGQGGRVSSSSLH